MGTPRNLPNPVLLQVDTTHHAILNDVGINDGLYAIGCKRQGELRRWNRLELPPSHSGHPLPSNPSRPRIIDGEAPGITW